MNDNVLETSLNQLRKELRATRFFCVISSFLTGALLVGGVLLFGQIKPVFTFVEEVQPVLEELSQLDMDGVNLTLEQISYTVSSVDWKQVSDAVSSVDWQQVSDAIGSVDWQTVSDSLSELDVDAINEAIEGLDTEELSKAIENLNNTVEALEGLREKISSFTGLFN